MSQSLDSVGAWCTKVSAYFHGSIFLYSERLSERVNRGRTMAREASRTKDAGVYIGVSRAVAVVFQRFGFTRYQEMPDPCATSRDYRVTEAEAREFLAEAEAIFAKVERSDRGKRRAVSVLVKGVKHQLERRAFQRFMQAATSHTGELQAD